MDYNFCTDLTYDLPFCFVLKRKIGPTAKQSLKQTADCTAQQSQIDHWTKNLKSLLPSPCTAFPSPPRSHGPRDPKRFGREEKWGLGTRQKSLKNTVCCRLMHDARSTKMACILSSVLKVWVLILRFILEIFLKFCKFQPRYSYKYILIKNKHTKKQTKECLLGLRGTHQTKPSSLACSASLFVIVCLWHRTAAFFFYAFE